MAVRAGTTHCDGRQCTNLCKWPVDGLPPFCNPTLTNGRECWHGHCFSAVAVMAPHALARGLMGLAALVAAVFTSPNAPVGAEDLPSSDQHVLGALALLEASPTTSQLRGVLDANHVAIRFVSMAPGIFARYSVARHTIEIDDRWIDGDEVTLAAVIAHEATHAQDAVSGYLASGGADACTDSEVRAFRRSALFWIDTYGPAGKPDAQNDLDRQLNSVADRQQRDPLGLADLVRQTYHQQCAH
jgi:hypothetical protein